jgi:hypothetical protein
MLSFYYYVENYFIEVCSTSETFLYDNFKTNFIVFVYTVLNPRFAPTHDGISFFVRWRNKSTTTII